MFNFHKLIVAGGRDFGNYKSDYKLLSAKLEDIRCVIWKEDIADDLEIVSGGARGADSLGERWAKEFHVPIKSFPANWELHKKRAGILRNMEMAEYSDSLLAFWDGKSPGTGHMISYATKLGLGVIVVRY